MRCRHGGGRALLSPEKMLQMYADGMSAPDVGMAAGISAQSVYFHLTRLGAKVRTVSEANKLAYKNKKYLRRSGPNHHSWKGGCIDKNGYKKIALGNGKQSSEHKVVWEKEHGPLPEGWIIHHLNGIRDDNRLENLLGIPRRRHSPSLIIDPFRKRILELESQIKQMGVKL
jgi:DNA-binding CsgD family transcriptional regulator